MKFYKILFTFFALTFVEAQEATDVEEVVVVGSQIKGAKITGDLPVSLVTAEDIEAMGIDSGDDLFANIAENGINNANQFDFNGGYNATRGDVGSINLRNIGT